MSNLIEQGILAIVLDKGDLAPILLANMNESFFEGPKEKLVFKTIKKLYEQRKEIYWPSVRYVLGDKLDQILVGEMTEAIRGVPLSNADRFLKESISKLKRHQCTREVLKELRQIANGPIDDDAIEHLKHNISEMELKQYEQETSSFSNSLDEFINLKNQNNQPGVCSGFTLLDKDIGGFRLGETITIMGRTFTGKTWLALNILNNLALNTEFSIGYFSMEMPKVSLLERIIQIYYDISRLEINEKISLDSANIDEFRYKYRNVHIFEKIYSIAEISQLIDKHNLVIVFIDFLGLIRPEIEGIQYEKITGIITSLKQLAKDCRIVLFVLHQLSRKAGSGWHPVKIEDGRDSGAIEELSDFIIGIWAPGLNPDPNALPLKNKLGIKLLKNKRGKQIGIICDFNPVSCRIVEQK